MRRQKPHFPRTKINMATAGGVTTVPAMATKLAPANRPPDQAVFPVVGFDSGIGAWTTGSG